MTVYALDPLKDSRWSDLVARHAHASAFHTIAWLQALERTYGYRPLVFTTAAPGSALEDGVVLCQVRSWLTGRRLVSLPFADHCEPLAASAHGFGAISAHLDRLRQDDGWDYVELRPHTDRLRSIPRMIPSERFWFHQLDLRPTEADLFGALHKNAIQQPIHRAERERVTCEESSGEPLLEDFYQLLLLTRRRHQLPPQPRAWFRNLAYEFGAAMKFRVARHDRRAIAAIVTLRHRDVMVYKYAASDATFHSLGGMQLLIWKTIQEARANECALLDLGRSDADNDGLVVFKDRWGARRSQIVYGRYAAADASHSAIGAYAMHAVRQVLGHAPQACRVAAGRFLYRHAG